MALHHCGTVNVAQTSETLQFMQYMHFQYIILQSCIFEVIFLNSKYNRNDEHIAGYVKWGLQSLIKRI